MSFNRAAGWQSLAGDKIVSWRENCLMLLAPIGPLHSGGGMSTWPSIWILTPDVSSTRSLDLAAMDTKLVAVN